MQDAKGIVFDGSGRAGGGGSYILDSHKSVDTFIDENRLSRKRREDESAVDTGKAQPPDVFRIAAPWDQVELQKELESTWYNAAKPIVLNKFKTPEEKAAAMLNLEMVKADLLRKAHKSGKDNEQAQKMIALYNKDSDLFPDNSGEYITGWMAKPIDSREPFALQPMQDKDWMKDIAAVKIDWDTHKESRKNADGTINYSGANVWDENKVKSSYELWAQQGNKSYRSLYKNALGMAEVLNPTASPEQHQAIARKKTYDYFRDVKRNQFGQDTFNYDRAQANFGGGGGGRSIKTGKYLWTKGGFVDNDGSSVDTYTISDPSGAQSDLPSGSWATDKAGGFTQGFINGVEVKNGETFIVIKTEAPKTSGSPLQQYMAEPQKLVKVPIDIFQDYNRTKLQGEYINGMTLEDLLKKFEGNAVAVNSPTTAGGGSTTKPKSKKKRPY